MRIDKIHPLLVIFPALAIVTSIIFYFANEFEKKRIVPKNKLETYQPDHIKSIDIEKLSDAIGWGLTKIKVNDTVTVLIYNDRDKCSMVQIK
jgi:hypothetical protein